MKQNLVRNRQTKTEGSPDLLSAPKLEVIYEQQMDGENHDLFTKRKFNSFPKNELLVTNDPQWFSCIVFWTTFSEALIIVLTKY